MMNPRSHIDRFFPVYFIAFLLAGLTAIAVQAWRRDAAFEKKCTDAGGVPYTGTARLCVRPNSLIEVTP
jgi:hypothetical protein